MILGQDVYQALAAFLTPHNPIFLAFLAVGLVRLLDALPGDEH
jgi:hypothetical protein